MKSLIKATELAKKIMEESLGEGDLAIDATMGNGNDTVFLAQRVGETGKVISFDIQQVALDHTLKLLKANNMHKRVDLVLDSHENIDKYVSSEASGIMFNLGYLPGGSRHIVTRPHSSLEAIQKSINLLKPNGIMTLVIYCGNSNGAEEKNLILDFVEKLESDKYHVLKIEYANQNKNPPLVVAVIKK